MDMFPTGWWIFPLLAVLFWCAVAFGLGAWIF